MSTLTKSDKNFLILADVINVWSLMDSFLVSVPEPLVDGNQTTNHKKKKTHNTVASRDIRDMFSAKRKNDDEPIMLE